MAAQPVDVGVAAAATIAARTREEMRFRGQGLRSIRSRSLASRGSSGRFPTSPAGMARFRGGSATCFLERIPRSRRPMAMPPHRLIEVLSTAGDPRNSSKAEARNPW